MRKLIDNKPESEYVNVKDANTFSMFVAKIDDYLYLTMDTGDGYVMASLFVEYINPDDTSRVTLSARDANCLRSGQGEVFRASTPKGVAKIALAHGINVYECVALEQLADAIKKLNTPS